MRKDIKMDSLDQNIIKDLAIKIASNDAICQNGNLQVCSIIKAFLSYYDLPINLNILNNYEEFIDNDLKTGG